jgi:delta24-sterol reductase
LYLCVLQLYPLWLCPFKLFAWPGMVHPAGNKDEMYVDIGAYGAPKTHNFSTIPTTKRLEAFVLKKKGWVFHS